LFVGGFYVYKNQTNEGKARQSLVEMQLHKSLKIQIILSYKRAAQKPPSGWFLCSDPGFEGGGATGNGKPDAPMHVALVVTRSAVEQERSKKISALAVVFAV
jgi:hypothetical protein